ncbi:hypothetical protein AWZ03_015398, partial [Drosophila navojoa]
EASAATSGSWSPDSMTSDPDEGMRWSPASSSGVATALMPATAWEKLEEERWDETLVNSYVRNGRYSPTRPLWRPPRPPTPHRAMPSRNDEAVVADSDEYAEYDEPVVIVDSGDESVVIVDSDDESVVIVDSDDESVVIVDSDDESPRVSASYAGKVVGGRLENRAEIVITLSEPLTPKPAGFTLEEISPQEMPRTPQQEMSQQATPLPPTPPETAMDVDEEWRPI